jgi:hypothetical protein
MALPDFSKFKAPYRFVPEGGAFRLYEKGEKTRTTFKTMAEAKKKVLALNNAWRSSPAGRKATPNKKYDAQGHVVSKPAARRAPRANPRKYDEYKDGAGFRKLSDLKKGEYIKRKADSRKVYRKGDYVRSEKKFSCMDTDDISREILLKGDTMVYVGFDY